MALGRKIAVLGIGALAAALAIQSCSLKDDEAYFDSCARTQARTLEHLQEEKRGKTLDREAQAALDDMFSAELPTVVEAVTQAFQATPLTTIGGYMKGYKTQGKIDGYDVQVDGVYWADDDVAEFSLASIVKGSTHSFAVTFNLDTFGIFSGSSTPSKGWMKVQVRPNEYICTPPYSPYEVFELSREIPGFDPDRHALVREYDLAEFSEGRRTAYLEGAFPDREWDTCPRTAPPFVTDPDEYYCNNQLNWFREGNTQTVLQTSYIGRDTCERILALQPWEKELGKLLPLAAEMRRKAKEAYWAQMD